MGKPAKYMYIVHSSYYEYFTYYLGLGLGSSVPAICCSTETDRSTVPSEDVRLPDFLGGKSVSLECITGQS